MALPRSDPVPCVSFLFLFRARTFFGLPKSQCWSLISEYLDRPERSHLLLLGLGTFSGAGAFLFSTLPTLSSFLALLRGWCCPQAGLQPGSAPPHLCQLSWHLSLSFGPLCFFLWSCHVLDLCALLFFPHQQRLNFLKLRFALTLPHS